MHAVHAPKIIIIYNAKIWRMRKAVQWTSGGSPHLLSEWLLLLVYYTEVAAFSSWKEGVVFTQVVFTQVR